MHPLKAKLMVWRRKKSAERQIPAFSYTKDERNRIASRIIARSKSPNAELFASHFLSQRMRGWTTYTSRSLAGQTMITDRRYR